MKRNKVTKSLHGLARWADAAATIAIMMLLATVVYCALWTADAQGWPL